MKRNPIPAPCRASYRPGARYGGGAGAWQLPTYITEIESAQGIIRSDERFQQTALE